jgi:hypothetical protein
MKTFTYTVTVEVEDDLGMPTECYDPDYFDQCETDYNEAGDEVTARWLYPETKAAIIMATRLGIDEEMGAAIGDYSIEYELTGNN